MTWARYSFPIEIQRANSSMTSPIVETERIDAIVPVKDDLPGLVTTLRSLGMMDPAPRRVFIVDDGSELPVRTDIVHGTLSGNVRDAHVLRLRRNCGAAAARNAALRESSGWVYLTDCGCEHPSDLFERFSSARGRSPADTIAIAGPVHAAGEGRIARYMTEQGNLNPPMLREVPQALITANALVWKPAADVVGGFDERFPGAGGEDIDFGLSLRRIGRISWAVDAVVLHEFLEDLQDFDGRFVRYGRGLRILAEKWGVDLTPYSFRSWSPDLQDLADRQTRMMATGYGTPDARVGP